MKIFTVKRIFPNDGKLELTTTSTVISTISTGYTTYQWIRQIKPCNIHALEIRRRNHTLVHCPIRRGYQSQPQHDASNPQGRSSAAPITNISVAILLVFSNDKQTCTIDSTQLVG
jgi:hypothetical protein